MEVNRYHFDYIARTVSETKRVLSASQKNINDA